MYCHFSHDYLDATLSTSYLTISRINMLRLKSIGHFFLTYLFELSVTDGRTILNVEKIR